MSAVTDLSAQGRSNRNRGARAEVQVVNWLRLNGHPDARRYLAGDGRQPGDIDAIPGLVIEVKDCARSAWPTWCRQAADEAAGRAWVVVRRLRGTTDPGAWSCHYWTPDMGGLGVATFRSFIRDFTTDDDTPTAA
jgi:hypothetical protein